MASIFKWINTIQEIEWNYYAEFSEHPIEKPLVKNNSSVNFIIQYFKQAGKEAISEAFDLENFGQQRSDHTVSIFFLGIIFFQNSGLKNKSYFNGIESKHYDFFQFIWFVCCLSHDAAFYREHEEALHIACPDINALKKHLNIEYDLTIEKVSNIPKEMFSLCEKYYAHRHKNLERPAVDHGIYAGLLMFDCLIKNRRIERPVHKSKLLWEDWLEPQYAYAAATVAVHNMWFPQKKDEKLYQKNGLASLIEKKPITLNEAPLLFLLGIVDTIDPIKAYQDDNLSCSEILKNVFLTFLGNDRFKFIISKKLNFQTFELRADSLNEWLNVNILKSERTIIIYVPFQ